MAAKRKAGDEVAQVVIPPLNLQVLKLDVEGTAPLVIGRFSEEAKATMRNKQQKKAVGARSAVDPEARFNSARYILPDGRDGVSAVSFKAALVEAIRYLPGSGLTMTGARGLFYILPDAYADDGYPLVALDAAPPLNWEAATRNSTGVADLRYRPRFEKWRVQLRIQYNAAIITPEQLVNLVQVAGFHVGIGHWRPQSKQSNTGHLGTFRVVTQEVEQ